MSACASVAARARKLPNGLCFVVFCGLTLGACSRGEHAKEARESSAESRSGEHRAIAPESAATGDAKNGAAAESAPVRTVGTPRPSRSSAGCGHPPPKTGDFQLQTTDGSGTTRDFRLVVPAASDPKKPLALTFVYHGANANEDAARGFGLQDAAGAATASIFAFPRGIAYQSFGVGWNDHCGGYDMIFFDHMLEALEKDYCIDENAVFAAGFSWGGDQATALACCRGNKLRAIAAGSATDEFSDPKNYKTYDNMPCPSSGTTAVRFTFDSNGDSALNAQMFASTSALFRSLNKCSQASTPNGACIAYQGCAEPYLECGRAGLGHALPPGWAGDTWRFFAGFMAAR